MLTKLFFDLVTIQCPYAFLCAVPFFDNILQCCQGFHTFVIHLNEKIRNAIQLSYNLGPKCHTKSPKKSYNVIHFDLNILWTPCSVMSHPQARHLQDHVTSTVQTPSRSCHIHRPNTFKIMFSLLFLLSKIFLRNFHIRPSKFDFLVCMPTRI